MPRDAEAWLAERGIEREPIRVSPPPAPGREAERPGGAAPTNDAPDRTDVSQREAQQLARAASAEAERRAAEAAATRPPAEASLADDVSEGLAFVRRSTANAPQSVGRLRRKLAERDTPPAAVDLIIERAHAERLVDDLAMATALVEERRAKGHAPTRLRKDLHARGFDRDTVDQVLAPVEAEDQEAAAFAVARDKADRLTGVEPDAAYRRTVGHVARRGYPEGLARKVARMAVDVSRDPARAAER
ncbi:MAG: regulatory protein RecX [Nitriliruptor sp.]